MVGSLGVRRESLQQQIEALERFDREYRARLTGFMQNQLRALWVDQPQVGELEGAEPEVGRPVAGRPEAGEPEAAEEEPAPEQPQDAAEQPEEVSEGRHGARVPGQREPVADETQPVAAER